MATLPQLLEEDARVFDDALREFLGQTSATAALIVDKGGFLITSQGDAADVDLTTLAALASGAFMASQTIAGLVGEKNFSNTYQQGEKFSVFVSEIDVHCLLIVLFKSNAGAGLVKYYSANCGSLVARQLADAKVRNPENGFDLSVLNVAQPQELFRKKI
jgi:predicted regulator of Ras-like GTPase activity (Roadblock/LC7/MglB family)